MNTLFTTKIIIFFLFYIFIILNLQIIQLPCLHLFLRLLLFVPIQHIRNTQNLPSATLNNSAHASIQNIIIAPPRGFIKINITQIFNIDAYNVQ
mmetsp:Transcript_26340/g.23233  ORF Transcript_26340/g.23233 Transcript_26340/m.23233 type:complete len:94 (+) Transcript_26340:359-640(+)